MDNNNNNNNNQQQPQQTPVSPPTTTTYPPQQQPAATTTTTTTATAYHHLLQQQQQQLQMFWSYQRQEIEQVNDFRNHQLPLARIKKIMKADEDVRMISAEAPILFAKACELFILELTIRSWLHAEENKRRTLQKNDIAAAITRTDIFDFLVDIVPREEIKDEGLGGVGVGVGVGVGMMGFGGVGGAAASGVPYYYPPMGAAPAAAIGRPAVDAATGMYVTPPSQAWQSVWQTAGVGVGVVPGGGNGDDGVYGSGGNDGQGSLDGQSDTHWT